MSVSSGKLQEPQPQLLLQLAGNRQRHLQHRTRLKKTGSRGLLAGFLNRFFSVSCVLVLFYFLNFCTPLFVIFFGYFCFALLSFMNFFFLILSPSMHMLFPFLSLSPFASFFLFWALGVCLESQTIFFAESFLFYSSITKLQMNSIF